MKFISLFAGIGGFDLGLERAGMECIAQVEKNPFCQKVLTKHWPHVPKFEDVRDVGKHNLPTAELICGGFPCQPHSLAGSRKASKDDRDLWGEFARIIRECQPTWVLAENVPGILSSETGRFFGRVLANLAASGYDVEWQSLSAAAFGAPHIRERVFIIAYHESVGKRQISISARRLQQENVDSYGLRKTLSNANSERQQMQRKPITTPQNSARIFTSLEYGRQWEVEPAVGRVVNGFPSRVDRLAGLGNAVIPQIAEFIGKCILNAQKLITQDLDREMNYV
jgi:DNA (cytosine-5)-methyltransferase 1